MVAMEEQSGRPELVENTHASKRTRIPVRGSARGGWVCAYVYVQCRSRVTGMYSPGTTGIVEYT